MVKRRHQENLLRLEIQSTMSPLKRQQRLWELVQEVSVAAGAASTRKRGSEPQVTSSFLQPFGARIDGERCGCGSSLACCVRPPRLADRDSSQKEILLCSRPSNNHTAGRLVRPVRCLHIIFEFQMVKVASRQLL